MSEPTPAEPVVDVREFTRAVLKAVWHGHDRRHEWVAECTCGEVWPCPAQKAWLLGVKAMFAALDELEALRASAGDVGGQSDTAP